MIKKIEALCDTVNNKLNRKPREVGSIEYRSSMFESSIVKMLNNKGGYMIVAEGSPEVLLNYLTTLNKDIDRFQNTAKKKLIKKSRSKE